MCLQQKGIWHAVLRNGKFHVLIFACLFCLAFGLGQRIALYSILLNIFVFVPTCCIYRWTFGILCWAACSFIGWLQAIHQPGAGRPCRETSQGWTEWTFESRKYMLALRLLNIAFCSSSLRFLLTKINQHWLLCILFYTSTSINGQNKSNLGWGKHLIRMHHPLLLVLTFGIWTEVIR